MKRLNKRAEAIAEIDKKINEQNEKIENLKNTSHEILKVLKQLIENQNVSQAQSKVTDVNNLASNTSSGSRDLSGIHDNKLMALSSNKTKQYSEDISSFENVFVFLINLYSKRKKSLLSSGLVGKGVG